MKKNSGRALLAGLCLSLSAAISYYSISLSYQNGFIDGQISEMVRQQEYRENTETTIPGMKLAPYIIVEPDSLDSLLEDI